MKLKSCPKYRVHNDGTITDTKTGLMWEQYPSEQQFTWKQAFVDIQSRTTGGYTDWRLPTRTELVSLIDDTRIEPAIDPVLSCQSNYYWSATAYQFDPSLAWVVNFYGGYVYAFGKSRIFYVRGVRGVENV